MLRSSLFIGKGLELGPLPAGLQKQDLELLLSVLLFFFSEWIWEGDPGIFMVVISCRGL